MTITRALKRLILVAQRPKRDADADELSAQRTSKARKIEEKQKMEVTTAATAVGGASVHGIPAVFSPAQSQEPVCTNAADAGAAYAKQAVNAQTTIPSAGLQDATSLTRHTQDGAPPVAHPGVTTNGSAATMYVCFLRCSEWLRKAKEKKKLVIAEHASNNVLHGWPQARGKTAVRLLASDPGKTGFPFELRFGLIYL